MSYIIDNNSKSAMEKYYLIKALPKFVNSNNQENNFKKDFYFYNDNTVWNNPKKTCRKQYNFYFKQKDENKHKLQNMEKFRLLDNLEEENLRKDRVLYNKNIINERLKDRKIERKALQLESSQKIELETEDELFDLIENTDNITSLYYKSYGKMKVNGRASNIWNDFSNTSKKNVNNSINNKIIKYDENAVNHIYNRITKEVEFEKIKEECYKFKYNDIRTLFKNQLNNKSKNRSFDNHQNFQQNKRIEELSLAKKVIFF